MVVKNISTLTGPQRTAAITVAALCLAGLLTAATGCEDDSPVEETIEAVDEAAEDVGRAVEDALD